MDHIRNAVCAHLEALTVPAAKQSGAVHRVLSHQAWGRGGDTLRFSPRLCAPIPPGQGSGRIPVRCRRCVFSVTAFASRRKNRGVARKLYFL